MNVLCEKLIRIEIIMTEGRKKKTFESREVQQVDGSRNWDFALIDA